MRLRHAYSGFIYETTDDGKCSLMLDEDAMLQLCNRAEMSARPRTEGGRVLDLQRGEMKATVGKQPADAPLEIHTPAAVAQILGTVVHVSVDPETGETLITSIESRIKVIGASGDAKAISGARAAEPADLTRCPDPLVVQTDWFPQPEHGALFNLTGGEGRIDAETGRFRGPLVADPES